MRLVRASSQALERSLSGCGAQAYLPHSMWDLPGPGSAPMSLHYQADSYPLCHRGISFLPSLSTLPSLDLWDWPVEAARDWSPDLCSLVTLIPIPCSSYHLAQLPSRYWHCPLLGHWLDKSLLEKHLVGPSSEQVKSI